MFTLSVFALIFGLVHVDAEKFREQTPVKRVAGYMLFVAIGLTAIYLIQAIGSVVTDQIPEIVTKTGHRTSGMPILSLSLMASWLVLGAVWLWHRRPWGYFGDAQKPCTCSHSTVTKYQKRISGPILDRKVPLFFAGLISISKSRVWTMKS